MKYGKGKVVSTAQEFWKNSPNNIRCPRLFLSIVSLRSLKSTYLDSLPKLVDFEGRVHTTFNQVGTATGRLSRPILNLQEHSHSHRAWTRDSRCFHPAPGNVLMSADYRRSNCA